MNHNSPGRGQCAKLNPSDLFFDTEEPSPATHYSFGPASTVPLATRDDKLTNRNPSSSPKYVIHLHKLTRTQLCHVMINIDQSGHHSFLTAAEEEKIRSQKQKLQLCLGDHYYNYAVTAAVSCLREIYKNSKDAHAQKLAITISQSNEQYIVEIADDGDDFSPEFLVQFPDHKRDGKILYPDLRSPKLTPYRSTKTADDQPESTGGSGKGLHYMSLITQGASDGKIFLNNCPALPDGIKLKITLTAGSKERAAYDFDTIISHNSQYHRIIMTPARLKSYAPPAPRAGSPVCCLCK